MKLSMTKNTITENLSETFVLIGGRSSTHVVDILDNLNGSTQSEAQSILHKYFSMVPKDATNAHLQFEYEQDPYSDNKYGRMYIEYTRPMTEEEIAKREEEIAAQTAKRDEAERLEYLRLQEKLSKRGVI